MPGIGPLSRQSFSMLQQWKRLPGQICHIPNTPQFRLVTSSGGTSALAFSPDGDWLACGSIDSPDDFPVLVYSMTQGSTQPSMTLSGHNRIVHSVAWSPNNDLLASASADGTVRLYNIKSKKPLSVITDDDTLPPDSAPIQDQPTTSDTTGVRLYEKRVLCHPCFVYCVVFHPRASSLLVTAGFDRVIRLWDVAVNRKDIIQQIDFHKGYINSIVFSSDGHTMYSGDSKGVIHVWKTPILELNKHSPYKEKWSREDTIEERDLHGVIINHLMLTPTGKRMMVHARDGNIRLMDLKIKAMVLKFHGIINSEKNLRSCLSPCGSFLFSGTENTSEGSQAYVWNALTGDHVAIYKDLNLPGAVNMIHYHPKCHMVAFSAIGSEASILVYAYSAENARLEMGYHSGNSSPNSPRHVANRPQINHDNMTKLEESKSRRLDGDEPSLNSFQLDYDKRQTDRLSRILNSLNTVTEVNQSLRRANRSLDRDMSFTKTQSTDGYGSGPEDKGRLMRANKKATVLQSIPMSLNATSATKANFTFKPPPVVKHREQSSTYLGEVIALYDYDAQRADELSFVRGELIKIVFRDGKNWLLGELSDGTQGYLPNNYVTGDEHFVDDTGIDTDKHVSPIKQDSRRTRFHGSDEVVDFQSTEPPMNASLKSSRRQRRRPSVNSPDAK